MSRVATLPDHTMNGKKLQLVRLVALKALYLLQRSNVPQQKQAPRMASSWTTPLMCMRALSLRPLMAKVTHRTVCKLGDQDTAALPSMSDAVLHYH